MRKLKIYLLAVSALITLSGTLYSLPIHDAVTKGDFDSVRKIIKEDSTQINISDNEGMAPIHLAVIAESYEIVSFLIENGAFVNITEQEKFTPLHLAAKNGNPDITELLLKHGADVTAIDEWGRSPLGNATGWGNDKRTVELLLDAGSDINQINSSGESILFSSLAYGSEDVIDLLIDRGAQLPDNEDQLRGAVYLTVSNGIERPFRLAIEKCNKMGINWWEIVSMSTCARGGSVNIAKELVAKGSDYNEPNNYGVTALHIGSEKGHFEFVNYLLSLGVDINFRSINGKSAYNYAIDSLHNDIAELLVSNGASVEAQQFPKLEGDYLGQKVPGGTPEIFAIGIVSNYGFNSEHSPPVFSPDGNEMFWTSMYKGPVFQMKRENGIWTAPEVAFFSSEYGDGEPVFSVDGNKLYFLSMRPVNEGGRIDKENLWYAERTKNDWSEAKPVSTVINKFDLHWMYSLAENGSLYFSSIRDGGYGHRDIYVSRFINGQYTEPENLGGKINSEGIQHTPFIAPDESYMIFISSGKVTNPGKMRFVISYKDKDGNWMEPIDLGDEINSVGFALCPSVTLDGKYMFFIGGGDIYWVSADFIEKLRPEEFM